MHAVENKTVLPDTSAGQLAAGAASYLQLLIVLLDTISERIFLVNTQGQITFVNKSFLAEYGLASNDVLGKSAEEILPKEIISACQKTNQWVFERGETICQETSWKDRESGLRRWSETHKYPMRDATGNITGIVGISRDITAHRKAEKELKRSESLLLHAARVSSLGELAAGIAHEVNQPLFSILNYAKAIENTLQDEETVDLEALRKWAQQIRQEAIRGGKITQRLKSFVKPAETQRKISAINQIVRDSIGFIAMEASDAEVVIETVLAEDLPEVVVDRIQIQQVLVNLLKNAIEACAGSSPTHPSATSPRVVISTALASADLASLGSDSTGIEVTVADNGPGVSIAKDKNILEPFQTTKNEGVGLGLAICKTIIEAHQHQLTYQTNDWGGATFCFHLPTTRYPASG